MVGWRGRPAARQPSAQLRSLRSLRAPGPADGPATPSPAGSRSGRQEVGGDCRFQGISAARSSDRPRRVTRVAFLGVVAAVTLAACLSPGPAPPRDDAVANDLISRHEALRTYLGIPPLGVDPGMNDHAQFHADRLATQAVGCQLWHSPELATWYAGFSAGENVACYESGTGVCPSDGKILMDEWVNSPPHLASILNGGFAWMGVGAACNGGRLFGVVQFRSG